MGKIKLFRSLEVVGVLLLLFGILLGFTRVEVLHVDFIRMDLVPFGLGFIGVLLFIVASNAISYERNKTKEQQIEEKDERMIQIHQSAKSKTFDIMAGALPLALLGLAILGYMNIVSFFILAGLYLLCIYIYYFHVLLNQKKM